MISQLIEALQQARLLPSDREWEVSGLASAWLSDEDLVDALWLALHLPSEEERPVETNLIVETALQESPPRIESLPMEMNVEPLTPPPAVPAYIPETLEPKEQQAHDSQHGLPIQVQAAPALQNALAIGRSLRPLKRKVPSLAHLELDIATTIDRIAQQEVWLPALRPALEHWLDLELVIEATPLSFIWQSTLAEFQSVLERQGAFRNVRTWQIRGSDRGEMKLILKPSPTVEIRSSPRSPRELIDPSGRRLVLLVSDCRSAIWQQGKIHDWLHQWSQYQPTAIVQLLPERLWHESELDIGRRMQVSAQRPGVPNDKLQSQAQWIPSAPDSVFLTLPVVTLTARSLNQLALVVAGVDHQRVPARRFDLSWVKSADADRSVVVISPLSAEARVELFLATASSPAQRLAGMMAAVPVSLPVVHLLQQRLLRDPDPVYIAEVYASGLLTPLPNPDAPAQPTQYDFLPEVRALLNRRTPLDETEAVWDTLSQEIVRSLGLPPIKSFTALLIPKPEWTQAVKDSILPFAQVVTQVLRELGGDYAAMAEMVEQDARRRTKWVVPILETESREFPPLQTLDFITAQLVDGPEPPPLLLQTEQFTVITLTLEPEAKGLEAFEFTVATLRRQQTGILQIRTEWVIQQRQQQAWPWVEPLGDDLVLEMVSIPGGRFLMGSPQNEPERLEWESPQHEVKVADFWMGRYPVTQAQWRFVAGLSRIDRSLDADPSYFKGENRPVETVSWYDATEFCARLSQHTGRSYRLPSEAEWEYACRAGTLTPFHFGEMIIPDLANYAWNETYNKSGVTKKKNFEGTTPVDRFGVANAFGLAEMHGNVWEWCLDHWHENYKGAPTDGSAWHSDNKNARRVRRGGSWNGIPRLCRSAYRFRSYPDIRDLNLGFRVVCVPPRTL